MSKQSLIITAVIVFVVVLGVFLVLQNNKSNQGNSQQTANIQSSPQNEESISKASLKSLLSLGKNVTCDISSLGEGSGNGKVYVSSNKMRGDFDVKVEETVFKSHIIGDGEFMYMWSDESKQGTKIKIDPNATIPPSQTTNQTTNIDQEVDMKCTPWNVDNSKFILPTTIQFTDFSSFLTKPSATQSNQTPKIDKSICDQISDPTAKAACLQSLGN